MDVSWTKLTDLSTHEGKLLGASCSNSFVGVWVVDLARCEPFHSGKDVGPGGGGTRDAPDRRGEFDENRPPPTHSGRAEEAVAAAALAAKARVEASADRAREASARPSHLTSEPRGSAPGSSARVELNDGAGAQSRMEMNTGFAAAHGIGADPMADLLKLCEEKEMLSRFDQVSLGQGQGPKAEAMIEKAMEEGMWVCLQNCHLAESWMPKLDVICETIDAETVHPDFRLWLSAMPSPAFPVAILQNGIKMTLEPPKGLKANLIRSYTRVTDEYMDQCKDPASHKRLLFSICLFHAVIQDRRKFGPLGWNIRYDFTDGDLNMCQRQIKMMIDDYEEIPYKVIRVLCGEINYGGRVTDSQDRRLMNNMLNSYIIPEVLTGVVMTFLVALLFDAVLVALGRVIMPWSRLATQPAQAGA